MILDYYRELVITEGQIGYFNGVAQQRGCAATWLPISDNLPAR
jgi:hypothetical protein